MPYSQDELRLLISTTVRELKSCCEASRDELRQELAFYQQELRMFA